MEPEVFLYIGTSRSCIGWQRDWRYIRRASPIDAIARRHGIHGFRTEKIQFLGSIIWRKDRK